MNDIIKWVDTKNALPKSARIPSERLNKYLDQGYVINQYDDEYFTVERKRKSGTKTVTCNSISSAELIVETTIAMETNKDEVPTGVQKSILDKAAILIGKLDVMYNGNDKVRRRY